MTDKFETLSEYVDWCRDKGVRRLIDVQGRLFDRNMKRTADIKVELSNWDVVDVIVHIPLQSHITLEYLRFITESDVNICELENENSSEISDELCLVLKEHISNYEERIRTCLNNGKYEKIGK